MKKINYENVTIENIQNLYKTGYIKEIIFDADNKEIRLSESDLLVIENAINKLVESIKPLVESVYNFARKMANVFMEISYNLGSCLNRKITKKKFIKLLQSEGIQRNRITEIVKNNKEPYTYRKYYKTLLSFKR